jgi:DNA-binding CsgD family transcriptional regulator
MKKGVIDVEQFSGAVSAIYDCAIDPKCWPGAIARIAGLIDGFIGIILAVEPSGNKVRYYVDWNADPGVMQEYAAYQVDDPLRVPFLRFDVDEPYNIPMVMDRSDWFATRLYQGFCKPKGWFDNIGVTLVKSPSRLTSLSIIRHESVGFAGPRELEIMRLLGPHLRKAVSIADLIEMRELTVTSLESSFDALLVSVLFVDRHRGIIHANAAARDLLAKGDPIRSERGALTALASDAAQRLEAAIAALDGDVLAGEASEVVYLRSADGRPAFAHVLPIASGVARRQIEPQAVAAIFIAPVGGPAVLPMQAWISAFGLTVAEVRVLERLIEGRTIVQVAAELDTAISTARTHLARLMQKTGSSRQADLVRTAMQLMSPLRPAKS